jgi:hypothetical protein
MKNLQFTKKDTLIVKGMAILLMFFHHLFAFPDRLNGGSSFIPLFYIGGTSIEEVVASVGNICVAIFLFLSGFGIYMKIVNSKENVISIIVKQLKKLYINYWIIFIIFVPVSFFVGIRSSNFDELFNNLIGYSSTYDGEWWFFSVYVLAMLTYPISIKIIRRSSISSIVCIMLMSVGSRTILPRLAGIDLFLDFTQTFFYNEISFLLNYLPSFLMGCTFAKFNLFSKIKQLFKENNLDIAIVYILILVGIIYLRYSLYDPVYYDYLFAHEYILETVHVVSFLKLDKVFAVLGKHSSNMWLMHSFFCYQYFQFLVYYPKITVIIVVWLAVICISCSWLIMFTTKQCRKIYNKLKNKVDLYSINSQIPMN